MRAPFVEGTPAVVQPSRRARCGADAMPRRRSVQDSNIRRESEVRDVRRWKASAWLPAESLGRAEPVADDRIHRRAEQVHVAGPERDEAICFGVSEAELRRRVDSK